MQEKTCTFCNETKLISEFYKDKTRNDGYDSKCKLCKKEYYNNNKDHILDYHHEYNRQNSETIATKNKHYRLSNKKTLADKALARYHKRYKSDASYRITRLLRRRVNSTLEQHTDTSLELLGCTVTYLKSHLQETAISNGYPDFDINDYDGSKYHIDHIIPCCQFDLSDPKQQRDCFNYSNLQILTSYENLRKGGH